MLVWLPQSPDEDQEDSKDRLNRGLILQDSHLYLFSQIVILSNIDSLYTNLQLFNILSTKVQCWANTHGPVDNPNCVNISDN